MVCPWPSVAADANAQQLAGYRAALFEPQGQIQPPRRVAGRRNAARFAQSPHPNRGLRQKPWPQSLSIALQAQASGHWPQTPPRVPRRAIATQRQTSRPSPRFPFNASATSCWLGLAVANRIQSLTPPLKPDCPKPRLSDRQSHPRQLIIQQIQCGKRAALILACIPARQPAIFVNLPQLAIQLFPSLI